MVYPQQGNDWMQTASTSAESMLSCTVPQAFSASCPASAVTLVPGVYMCWTHAEAVQPREVEGIANVGAYVQSIESLRQQGVRLDEIYPMLAGRVWQLAMDKKGCRLVQALFEDVATSDAMRSALASELRTHVCEAIQSPHGNHVIQKCIAMMRPSDTQFILAEILQAGALAVAQHQYGCRILQRLFEHSQPDQLHQIADNLLIEAVPLCKHIYGSLVIQHLLQHGEELQSHISCLVDLLAKNVATLGSHPYAVSVLEKALHHASEQDRIALVQALVEHPEALVSMSSWRHGNCAAKLALEKAAPQQRKRTLVKIQQRKQKLQTSRYGKKLLACVESLLREEEEEAACTNKSVNDE
jgi:hypothetical protein